jgi:hypothetical protein
VTELERKHLVETDRHIAECKNYIAKQRELIERAIQRGRPTEVAETTLEALVGRSLQKAVRPGLDPWADIGHISRQVRLDGRTQS